MIHIKDEICNKLNLIKTTITNDKRKNNKHFFVSATSNGTESGMRNQAGGLCRSHDMRLALKVSGKASSKSDTNRSPDILSLLSPFSVINFFKFKLSQNIIFIFLESISAIGRSRA